MSDSVENKVIQGYLDFYARGVGTEYLWSQRYYVLHGRTSKQEPRLDWYDNENSFKKDPDNHRSLYMQQVASVTEYQDAIKKHSFVIVTKDGGLRHCYAAKSKALKLQWIDCLQLLSSGYQTLCQRSATLSSGSETNLDYEVFYEMSDEFSLHEATVSSTDASVRCSLSGTYMLRLNLLNLTLCRDNKVIFIWPYRFIRRYGRSRSTFTFEAGRKCPSGEGLFTFKVDNGTYLFEIVQQRTKEMKERDNEGDFIKKPPVPVKRYNSLPDHAMLPKSDEWIDDDEQCVSLPMPPPRPMVMDNDYEVCTDSGFSTMESSSLGTRVPVVVEYSDPFEEKRNVDSSDEEYTDPLDTPQTGDSAKSMSELVTAMNKARMTGEVSKRRSHDSYDHIDLRKTADRPDSGNLDEEALYGDMTLEQRSIGSEDNDYCVIQQRDHSKKK